MATEPAPQPLRPATTGPGAGPLPLGIWITGHAFGLAALVIGAITFVVATLLQGAVWSTPDLRVTLPCFVGALIVAVASIARREGTLVLPLVGVGLAAIALVLGWFLVMAIIVAVTAVLILLLSLVL